MNINIKGEVCLAMLSDNWGPLCKVIDILTTVQTLLYQPNPEDPLVAELASLYVSDKKAYLDNAKEWVKKYAGGL
jgi:ubiquitin-conjugating enzyme E2 D/E